jgi:peptidoglycan/xylan/chitin deacetylase (PgdA/CDA1 family)
MRTRVVITVDVEGSIAGMFLDPQNNAPMLDVPVWGDIDGQSHGLGFLIDSFRDYDLKATFFVETAQTCYFPEDKMGRYARLLSEAGHDVALHLHPVWLNLRDGKVDTNVTISDQCADLSMEALTRLVAEGAGLIEHWTGRAPVSFRSGNYSVSSGINEVLRQARIPISSNICVAVAPSSDPAYRHAGGVIDQGGVLEVPVTCFTDHGPVGRGRLRGMQVTACGFREHRAILTSAHEMNASVIVIVTHPFEFLKYSNRRFENLRPNKMIQNRFGLLCHFLRDNSDKFDVTTFREISEKGIEPEKAVLLDGSAFLSLGRSVKNFVNDSRLF